VPVAGAVLVTTPQTVSLADTRRAVAMYRKLNIPAIGLIENMSYFICPGCQRESDIFGKGGGEALAAEMKVPFLGSIPLYEPVRIGSDNGVPIVVSDPDSPPARAIFAAAERVAQQISISAFQRKAIPLTQIQV
jgi:ATP-binding protein involved in chromosome partitioning